MFRFFRLGVALALFVLAVAPFHGSLPQMLM